MATEIKYPVYKKLGENFEGIWRDVSFRVTKRTFFDPNGHFLWGKFYEYAGDKTLPTWIIEYRKDGYSNKTEFVRDDFGRALRETHYVLEPHSLRQPKYDEWKLFNTYEYKYEGTERIVTVKTRAFDNKVTRENPHTRVQLEAGITTEMVAEFDALQEVPQKEGYLKRLAGTIAHGKNLATFKEQAELETMSAARLPFDKIEPDPLETVADLSREVDQPSNTETGGQNTFDFSESEGGDHPSNPR